MKKKLKYMFTTFVVVAITAFANGQCNDAEFQKLAKKELNPYQLEVMVSRPVSSFAKSSEVIEATFFAYQNEDYKFVNLSQGFTSRLPFKIFDPQNQLVFSSEGGKTTTATFQAAHDGNYVIQFSIPKADASKASACIAFAVGYSL